MQKEMPNMIVKGELLKIGGLQWRAVQNSTLEHDFHTVRIARSIGVDADGMLPGESAEDFASRLLFMVIDSGKIFELLGCLMLPNSIPDSEWTPEQAEKTAQFMRALRDPGDKDAVQSFIVSLLIGFFSEGLRYSIASGIASKRMRAQSA